MKNKQINKKLSLNKTTIAGLNTHSMISVHGGQINLKPSIQLPCILTDDCTRATLCGNTCTATCFECTFGCPSVRIPCDTMNKIDCQVLTEPGVE